jgi:hypothetical protein
MEKGNFIFIVKRSYSLYKQSCANKIWHEVGTKANSIE